MKLISQTSWFNEHPASLVRLIESMAGVVDVALFVDGPYADFPHTFPKSSADQYEAIRRACDRSGIACQIMDGQVYPSQAAKRTAMFEWAAEVGQVHDDYTLVIDADEVIEACDVDCLRSCIDEYRPDAVQVALETPEPTTMTLQQARGFLGIQYPKFSTSVHGRGVERIFVLVPDPLVGPKFHGEYRGTNARGVYVKLKHRGRSATREPHGSKLDLSHLITIRNDTWQRPIERIEKKSTYGRKRTREGYDL